MRRDPTVKLVAGIYERDGRVYQVKPSQAGDLYAKVLDHTLGDIRRLTASGATISADYVYAPGAVRELLPEHRLTADRAQELSILVARCLVCGDRLTDARSVQRGIGPVCRTRI